MEVDIVKAWSDLDKSLIAEGLVSGMCLIVTELYCIINAEKLKKKKIKAQWDQLTLWGKCMLRERNI